MRLRLSGRILGLAGGSLGEVGLMALPLGVGQVIPLVVVKRQAQLALIAAGKPSQRLPQRRKQQEEIAPLFRRRLGFSGIAFRDGFA